MSRPRSPTLRDFPHKILLGCLILGVGPLAGAQIKEEKVQLQGFSFQAQTYNNCGPATLSMLLNHWGHHITQETLKEKLRSSDKDPAVTLEEMQNYCEAQGFKTWLVWDTKKEDIQNLLDRGIPVLVKIWLGQTPSNQYSHSLLITGYDAQRIYTQDSLRGPDFQIGWEKFLKQWELFGNSLLVVLPQGSPLSPRVFEVFPGSNSPRDRGELWLKKLLAGQAPGGLHKELLGFTNAAAWHFQVGLAAHLTGDFPLASQHFTQAFNLGLPIRILWYFSQPLEAWFKALDWKSLRTHGSRALNFYPHLDEVKYWMEKTIKP